MAETPAPPLTKRKKKHFFYASPNNHYHNNYLEHMEMGIHRDSDKGWDEMLVWSPSVRKPQLDENNVGCVRKPQMNEDVKALLLS